MGSREALQACIQEHELGLSIGDLLGKGTEGSVFKVCDQKTDSQYAAKVGRSNHNGHDGVPTGVIREIATLRALQHPNIVRLLDVHVHLQENTLVIVQIQELMPASLERFVRKGGCKPGWRKVRCKLAVGILSGLAFLHDKHHAIHHDVKSANILVDPATLTAKLADFGLARSLTCLNSERLTSKEKYTFTVRPPEVWRMRKHSRPSPTTWRCDMWAAGCVVAEMCIGHEPFLILQDETEDAFGKRFKELLRTKSISDLAVPQHANKTERALILGLLQIDPKDRLSAKAGLKLIAPGACNIQ